MYEEALALFSEPVARWFASEMGPPTRTQALGWPVLNGGGHALVCAPTGTGKTLCAFLRSIDRLLALAKRGELDDGVRVLYISPLKALGNDIERNLDFPLEGIAKLAPEAQGIRKMVRSGDTPASERRRMAGRPPHILITTPESLYLLLTSQAAEFIFDKLETVIVDEVHALLDGKRGTHLSLSLERLSRIADYQRVGLSATVEPMSEAAHFLGGNGREVTVVDARADKKLDVLIECPAQDFRVLPEHSIWPEVAKTVYNYASAQRQTLVFCNNRMISENVATAVNRLAEDPLFAATHHGSLDKARRLETEENFKAGRLRCLCATSSLELGIDIGSVDLVIQIASPRSASRGLQRLGRAGHRPGETSVMRILPRTPSDALESALVGRLMLAGDVESMFAPKLCLDVLAQHVVSMACREEWRVEDILSLARGAYAYSDLTKDDLLRVLKMLRGDYEHAAGRDARPRIYWDENEGTVRADQYGRMLATRGGTIPDRGQYPVITAEGARVGELDEEFVFEARMGDRFTLGAFTWAIVRIQHDRVVVTQSGDHARAPFWRGDGIGRPSETGEKYGREMALIERQQDIAAHISERFPVDGASARAIARLMEAQLTITGCLPTDRRVLAEHFKDESGECFLAIHCLLGGRVNQVLAFALRDVAMRLTGKDAQAYHNDDGLMLHVIGEKDLPGGLLESVDPDGVRAVLLRDLPGTPLFAIQFRQAAAIALMLGGGRAGKRTPLWVQRLRGAEALSRAAEASDHPMVIETYRQCIDRMFEVDRAIRLLRDIRSGEVKVVEARPENPSQLTRELRQQLVEFHTYYEALPADIAAKGALTVLDAVAPPKEAIAREPLSAKDEDGLYALLLKCGALPLDALAGIVTLVGELLGSGRALNVQGLLVARHEAQALADGLEGDAGKLRPFLQRYLRAVGEAKEADLARFGSAWREAMEGLASEGIVTAYNRDGRIHYALVEDAVRAISVRTQQLRAQINTVEDGAYAAMLPVWQQAQGAIPASRFEDAMKPLYGLYLDTELWEGAVLPARVTGYRPRDLDQALLTGELIWRVSEGKTAFFPPEDAFLPPQEGDGAVYRALLESGAQFMRQLSRKTGIAGAELERELQHLVSQGLAVCDGFAPMRDRRMPGDAKHAARARSIEIAREGRWEAAGMPAPLPPDRELARLFDRFGVVSRECAAREGIEWQPLMDALRNMEFADEVRRGYFVRGLSGAQFVRTTQFERIIRMLAQPEGTQVLCAADPAQAYGQLLSGAGFMCVPGTAVVLMQGEPVLVAERRGEVIRLLGGVSKLGEALAELAKAFQEKRIWPGRARITAKTVPDGAQDALREAGFLPDMLDFTLWRD